MVSSLDPIGGSQAKGDRQLGLGKIAAGGHDVAGLGNAAWPRRTVAPMASRLALEPINLSRSQ
jgi:hypothetical protein